MSDDSDILEEDDPIGKESADLAFKINQLIAGSDSVPCILSMFITIMSIAEDSGLDELSWISHLMRESNKVIVERYNKLKRLQ